MDRLDRYPEDRQIERRASRMREMLDRLGVDTAALLRSGGGCVFAAAQQRCLACREVSECLAWLDGRRQGDDMSAFCPNASTFAAFKSPAGGIKQGS